MYNFLLFVVDCSFNFLRTKLDAKNTSFISTPVDHILKYYIIVTEQITN